MTPDTLTTEQELIPPGAYEVLPPYGFVRLLEARGTDLDVVNAARVSFNKESVWHYEQDGEVLPWPDDPTEEMGLTPKILSEVDEKVLRFLMKNHHGTPFEHTYFKFHVRAPIFVFREWHRHRIGVSINEESARYVELQPHFYVPSSENMRTQTDKPGRYKFERLEPQEANDRAGEIMDDSFTASYARYRELLSMGVAKEVARGVLPVGIYSQMIWTCNARSLMAFLNLRNADMALREIRLYASAMEAMFAEHMPVTHSAFVEGGRVAP